MPSTLGVVAAVYKLAFTGLPYFDSSKSANWPIHLGLLGKRGTR